MKRIFVFAFFIFAFVFYLAPRVAAQECTDDNIAKVASTTDQDFLGRLLAKCGQRIADMETAVKPHRDELNKMNAAIAAFQARIAQIEADVVKKTAEIN